MKTTMTGRPNRETLAAMIDYIAAEFVLRAVDDGEFEVTEVMLVEGLAFARLPRHQDPLRLAQADTFGLNLTDRDWAYLHERARYMLATGEVLA